MFSRKPAPRQMATKVSRGMPRPWSRKPPTPPDLTSGEWSRDSLLIADDPAPDLAGPDRVAPDRTVPEHRPSDRVVPHRVALPQAVTEPGESARIPPNPGRPSRQPAEAPTVEETESEWSRFARALGDAPSRLPSPSPTADAAPLTRIGTDPAPAHFVDGDSSARIGIESASSPVPFTDPAAPVRIGTDLAVTPFADSMAPVPSETDHAPAPFASTVAPVSIDAEPTPAPVADDVSPAPAPVPIPLSRRLERLAPSRPAVRVVSPDPDAPTPPSISRVRLARLPGPSEVDPEAPPAFLRALPDPPSLSEADLDPSFDPAPHARRLSAVDSAPPPYPSRSPSPAVRERGLGGEGISAGDQEPDSNVPATPLRERSKRRRYDRPGEIEPLPPALPSMWRLCKLGYQHEPSLMLIAFTMALLAALPDALIALWLKLLGEGVAHSNALLIVVAAFALALSSAGTWLVRTVSARVQRTFRDRVTIALEAHVARLQSSIVTVAHQERPEYLDRLAVLRDQVFVLDHMYMSLFSTCGWVLRLGVTMLLLMAVHPVLVLLAACALPPVLSATWRPAVEREAHERGAQAKRLARHLFNLATTAPAGKEVRVTGIGARLIGDRRAAWDRWYGPVSDARWTSAVFHTLGWMVFGGAYVGAVVFVAAGLNAPAAEVLVVLVAGARLSAYVGATVGEIGFLRGIWMDGSRRLVWLEEYAAAQDAHDDLPAPLRLNEGIRFDHVSFTYPGTDKLVLNDVSLDLPAGAVVAIVGENGAGKSTLIKLLGKLYEPSAGEILVDGLPLSRMPAESWRAGLAGAMQDFYRFEFRARQTVGLGDLPRLNDPGAVETAVERAGAEDVVKKLPSGLDTRLGATWPGGVEVSFGQWQKLALARGFMRDEPLLLILDEPTAALDAETEHALFEKYAAAARGESPANGRITVLVSHRFSTVRMADLIVVLDGARIAEVGSHEDLIAKGGQYAELYNIQAAAYR